MRSKKIYTININTYKLFILKSTKKNDRSKIMISPLIYFVSFMTCTYEVKQIVCLHSNIKVISKKS